MSGTKLPTVGDRLNQVLTDLFIIRHRLKDLPQDEHTKKAVESLLTAREALADVVVELGKLAEVPVDE